MQNPENPRDRDRDFLFWARSKNADNPVDRDRNLKIQNAQSQKSRNPGDRDRDSKISKYIVFYGFQAIGIFLGSPEILGFLSPGFPQNLQDLCELPGLRDFFIFGTGIFSRGMRYPDKKPTVPKSYQFILKINSFRDRVFLLPVTILGLASSLTLSSLTIFGSDHAWTC